MKNPHKVYRICSFYTNGYEEFCLLGYAVLPTNILEERVFSIPVSKKKPSEKQA
jgi:hypothetical protein